MPSLIDISNPQAQLRTNRSLWAVVGGVGSVLGVLLWSSSPFILHNQKDKTQVCLRYLSLVTTLCSGAVVVVAGSHLTRIDPLIKAVEISERSDFLTQLAASQFSSEQRWNNLATAQQPQQALPEQEPPAQLPPAADYRQLFLAVKALRQAGVDEAQIIQTVLLQDQSNGKATLAALMTLGRNEGW